MPSFTTVEAFLLDSGTSFDSFQIFSHCQGIDLYIFNLLAWFLVRNSFFSVSLLLLSSSRDNNMQVSTCLRRRDTVLLVISIQLERKVEDHFKTRPYY